MEYHFFQGIVLETGDGQVQKGLLGFRGFNLGNFYLAGPRVGNHDGPDCKVAQSVAKLQNVPLGSAAYLYGMGAFVFVQGCPSALDLWVVKTAIGGLHGI